jgi:enoyl-CoA hydratase
MKELPEVITRRSGRLGLITLNRAGALHALNTNMCRLMIDALVAWREDPAVTAVLVDHAEDTRGFCAGGDIRMLAESGAKDGKEAREFFFTEYRLNHLIQSYPKPYVALIDGVTMGGGVGISVHGDFRVATERTTFAMPETGIGLFPDVGARTHRRAAERRGVRDGGDRHAPHSVRIARRGARADRRRHGHARSDERDPLRP